MPFVLKEYRSTVGQKIQYFLQNNLGFTISTSQKLLAKGRVFDDKENKFKISQIIRSNSIKIAIFQGSTKGLFPLFTTNDFAIFDKPSGIMVHPISKNTKYTLLDEVKYHFGDSANLVHRIDLETSGLVIVAKNKNSDTKLKKIIQDRQIVKKYLAIVYGKLDKPLCINTPILKDNGIIGVKMAIGSHGKIAKTIVIPLKYYKNKDQTLIEIEILTGRQHQIRVHLNSIGHTIVGDPIYGVSKLVANNYLNKNLTKKQRIEFTGNNRLMLHAHYLAFKYNNLNYKIFSKQHFLSN